MDPADASSVASIASDADAPPVALGGPGSTGLSSFPSDGTAIGVTPDPPGPPPMPPPLAVMAAVVWNMAPPAINPKRTTNANAASVLFASIALARRWNAAGSFPSRRVRLE